MSGPDYIPLSISAGGPSLPSACCGQQHAAEWIDLCPVKPGRDCTGGRMYSGVKVVAAISKPPYQPLPGTFCTEKLKKKKVTDWGRKGILLSIFLYFSDQCVYVTMIEEAVACVYEKLPGLDEEAANEPPVGLFRRPCNRALFI
ncbi:unnamed protein product [Leuciscus chuanchicus]